MSLRRKFCSAILLSIMTTGYWQFHRRIFASAFQQHQGRRLPQRWCSVVNRESNKRNLSTTCRFQLVPRDFDLFGSPSGQNPFRRLSSSLALSSTSVDTKDANTQTPFYLQDLNPSQLQAVTQPSDRITRVIAGPGSGKTRVLTCRMAHLLHQDPQGRVLGVTFTRKASGEMQERLQKLLSQNNDNDAGVQDHHAGDRIVEETLDGMPIPPRPRGMDRVTLGTFHSICAKILRWNGELLCTLGSVTEEMMGCTAMTQLDGNFAIIDQGEQLRIVKDLMPKQPSGSNSGVGEELKPLTVASMIANIKSKRAGGEDILEGKRSERELSKAMQVALKIYPKYRQHLFSTNSIDFDDLIYMARELLMENEDVRERLTRRWTHVLVDEFQDTSRPQMELVKLLATNSLLVVGDADQSIYSWRGAHVGSLADFDKDFPQVDTVYLMENYRSTSNIVKAAQKVISATSSEASSSADQLRQSMKPKRGSGPSPRVIACKDAKSEAEFIVKSIKERLLKGEFNSDTSVALIYRTNAQSRALEEACVKQNLPYVIFGSATSFYKRQEVKDCLCFLRWLQNGRDRSSMLRAIVTPRRGIGETAIREFEEYCEYLDSQWAGSGASGTGPTPFDALLSLSGPVTEFGDGIDFDPTGYLSTRPLKLFREFSAQMRKIRDMALIQPVEQIISLIISELELKPHLDKISKSKAEFEERKANIEELRQAAGKYSADGACLEVPKETENGEFKQSPLRSFLDDVALVADMSENNDGKDDRFVVSLMTIHASKGMEFDVVCLVGNEDGTLPTFQAIQEGEGSNVLEEEKRLCYVAMTRAKTELLLTWRKEVPVFTPNGIRYVDKDRSRFLDVLVSGKSEKSRNSKASTNKSRNKGTKSVYKSASASSGWTQPRSQNGAKSRQSYSSQTTRSPSPAPVRKPATRKLSGTAAILGKQRKASPFDRQSPSAMSASRPASPSSNPRARMPSIRAVPQQAGKQYSNSVHKRAPLSGQRNPSSRPAPFKVTAAIPPSRAPPTRRSAPPPTKQKSLGRKPPQAPEPVPKMDSTWFFPVGSQVIHKNLGTGTVLPPPPSEANSSDLPVRVRFESGERDFCAHGTDISIL